MPLITGKCLKPERNWRKNPKPVRRLRRNLPALDDKAGIPRRLNSKWMGLFTWNSWTFPDEEYLVVRRNGRKLLLKKKGFEPDEYYLESPLACFPKVSGYPLKNF